MNEVWLVILPLIAGYLLDLAFGDPRTIPHPVVGFGNMISWAERHFNCGRFRKWKGAVVALSFPLFAGMAGWGITVGTLAVGDWCFCIVASVFVFYGLANHSLIREGREVVDILKKQGVEAGRRRLSWIVGRDTSELSPKGIYTAVLETMAENLSDGVVAPLFYYALGGFPAMMAYKMVNTLDSMIGYKDERYRQFGCMAARLDDVLNYIPVRYFETGIHQDRDDTLKTDGKSARRCIDAGKFADQLVVTSAACNGAAEAFHGNLKNRSGIVAHAAHQRRVKSLSSRSVPVYFPLLPPACQPEFRFPGIGYGGNFRLPVRRCTRLSRFVGREALYRG